jgi:hypothetical protein
VRYHAQKDYAFLFGLMEKYELAYYQSKTELIIPRLLPADRPKDLLGLPSNEMMRYEANSLLRPDTISRFIVHHHTEIKSDKYLWRSGVILDDGKGTIALVREDDRSIVVSVKGIDKFHYRSILQKTLDDIFEGYKTQKTEMKPPALKGGVSENFSLKSLSMQGEQIPQTPSFTP